MNTRAKQRHQNYMHALQQLEDAVVRASKHPEDVLIQAGLIQFFEITAELGWKLLKDILQEKGYTEKSPKEVVRRAFSDGIIDKGEDWILMLKSRNETSHLYNKEISDSISKQICKKYLPLLQQLHQALKHDPSL